MGDEIKDLGNVNDIAEITGFDKDTAEELVLYFNRAMKQIDKRVEDSLDNLPPEQRKKALMNWALEMAKEAWLKDFKKKVRRMAETQDIDIDTEVENFLRHFKSPYTLKNYRNGIKEFREWVETNHTGIFDIEPQDADNYIFWLETQKKSPATIRLRVAVISAFYTYLERSHQKNNQPLMRNPFTGTRARPKNTPVKELRQPTEQEVKSIIENAVEPLRLAFSLMANEGLRIGALSSLVIKDDRYEAKSKGKTIRGELSEKTKQIFVHGKYSCKPYASFKTKSRETLSAQLKAEQKRQGAKVIYNPHSFRHYYATKLYGQTKDIYLVSRKLHHSSILVTERYLQKLNLID